MSENSSQEEEPVSKRSKTGVFSQEEIECNIQQKYEEILERSEQMCTSLHNAINEAHSVFANDLRIILETKQSEYDNLYAVYLDKEAMLERALASLRMFSGIELDFEEEEEGDEVAEDEDNANHQEELIEEVINEDEIEEIQEENNATDNLE